MAEENLQQLLQKIAALEAKVGRLERELSSEQEQTAQLQREVGQLRGQLRRELDSARRVEGELRGELDSARSNKRQRDRTQAAEFEGRERKMGQQLAVCQAQLRQREHELEGCRAELAAKHRSSGGSHQGGDQELQQQQLPAVAPQQPEQAEGSPAGGAAEAGAGGSSGAAAAGEPAAAVPASGQARLYVSAQRLAWLELCCVELEPAMLLQCSAHLWLAKPGMLLRCLALTFGLGPHVQAALRRQLQAALAPAEVRAVSSACPAPSGCAMQRRSQAEGSLPAVHVARETPLCWALYWSPPCSVPLAMHMQAPLVLWKRFWRCLMRGQCHACLRSSRTCLRQTLAPADSRACSLCKADCVHFDCSAWAVAQALHKSAHLHCSW